MASLRRATVLVLLALSLDATFASVNQARQLQTSLEPALPEDEMMTSFLQVSVGNDRRRAIELGAWVMFSGVLTGYAIYRWMDVLLFHEKVADKESALPPDEFRNFALELGKQVENSDIFSLPPVPYKGEALKRFEEYRKMQASTGEEDDDIQEVEGLTDEERAAFDARLQLEKDAYTQYLRSTILLRKTHSPFSPKLIIPAVIYLIMQATGIVFAYRAGEETTKD